MSTQYELLYHPTIPGRGEFIRLAFEATGTEYVDVANASDDGYDRVRAILDFHEKQGTVPPVFAPPALRVAAGRLDDAPLLIHQTPNILLYLGERLGLTPAGKDETGRMYVHQLALTALDLNNEIHDTHHPIAVMKYYEDQKPEALKKAQDVRENRIPKFLSYFERVLQWNHKNGHGEFLVGDQLTYADLVVWQVLDGTQFAFPKEMVARKKDFPGLLTTFYESVRQVPRIKAYLASGRRLPYGQGVFRYYPELDRQ